MKVLLVDPSLFTGPYDAALDGGLRANGIVTSWAVRDLRMREEPDLAVDRQCVRFYPVTDGLRRKSGRFWKAVKGAEHFAGLSRLEKAAASVDVVHFQWAPLPALDAPAMRRIARARPVVLTVHDTEPFNGASVSRLQVRGFDTLFDTAHHLIVHTEQARDALLARGTEPQRISIVRHGPLHLRCAPRPVADKEPGRWRVVLFGRLQSYKGVDLLIEALGTMAPDARARLQVIVAGEPFVPVEPLEARARDLGLDSACFQLRPHRLDDQAMADLLGSADAFVFPYRAIEASGVLFLVAGLRKWIIASDLGAFRAVIGNEAAHGVLVPAGDVQALAAALVASIDRKPLGCGAGWAPEWDQIGLETKQIYVKLLKRKETDAVG